MSKHVKKPDDAMTVARHALSLAQSVVRAPERKFFQLSSQNTNFLTGTVTHITGLSQGVTSSSRIGDRIRAQRLRLRMKVYALVSSDTTFRVALVKAKGTNAPAVTSVWATDDTQSQRNRDLDQLFTVLKEETVVLNASFLNGDVAGQLDWDVGLGFHIDFNGAAAINPQLNSLYIVITNDVADSSSSITKPAIADTGMIFRSEVEFTDP